jgi:hypothetical protein
MGQQSKGARQRARTTGSEGPAAMQDGGQGQDTFSPRDADRAEVLLRYAWGISASDRSNDGVGCD